MTAFTFDSGRELDDVLAPVRSVTEKATGQLPFVRTMTRRVLDHIAGGGLDLSDEVAIVPADVFTSAQRHAADREMMKGSPHVVAWGGEIPAPGDFTTKDVMGTPVLLVPPR